MANFNYAATAGMRALNTRLGADNVIVWVPDRRRSRRSEMLVLQQFPIVDAPLLELDDKAARVVWIYQGA